MLYCVNDLGVNGAGKTTTFRMLTGDETISGGTAYMNGLNIRTDIHQVNQNCDRNRANKISQL